MHPCVKRKIDAVQIWIREIQFYATSIYLFLVLLIFPLYVEDHYWRMAFCKWRFYFNSTVFYLAVMLLCGSVVKVLRGTRAVGAEGIAAGWRRGGLSHALSACDGCVVLYGICVLIPLLLGDDRRAVWTGADGWYMGAAAQILFVLSYFVISRSRISVPVFLGCNAAGSGVCFLLGILQRLGFDFLHMYDGMENILLSDFLSTIGNRTWMSGYVCAVFPIGVYLFWRAEERRQKLLWGLYSGLAFAGLAATYSDSAYVGLGIVFLALGILSIGDGRRLFAFWQVLCLWFGQALLMCGLRAVCGERVRDARGVSCYVYEWSWMLVGFAVCVMLAVRTWFVYLRDARKSGVAEMVSARGVNEGCGDSENEILSERVHRLQRRCVAAAGIGGIVLILLIVLNTAGVLERVFHITIHNSYFYFDDKWGDMRGWTWRMACRMFGELPLFRKLFGVGADCFAAHGYSRPEYIAAFSKAWGDVILTNAHNEWLNMFFCQGIVGGAAYLGIFVSGAAACLRRVTEDIVPAIGLCVLAYVSHNFFCYQQICATGPVFVLLGVAMSLMREHGYEMSKDIRFRSMCKGGRQWREEF